MKLTKYYVSLFPLFVVLFMLNYSFEYFAESGYFAIFRPIKILLVFAIISVLLLMLRNLMKVGKQVNVHLSVIATLLTLMLAELVFTFIARSHHAEVSYASINWDKRYYQLNTDGFRDTESDCKNQSKPALIFLGDSYTAGYGLDNTSERYSDKVGNLLKGKFEFYNLGIKGTGLTEHRKLLSKVKNPDKILIYQTYINDLDEFCGSRHVHYDIYVNFSRYDKYWAKSMFLLNYIYFSFSNDKLVAEYFNFFRSCSNSEENYKAYINELKNMLVQAHSILGYKKIIVVVMPALTDFSFSAELESRIISDLSGINYVHLLRPSVFLSKLAPTKRIVNAQDVHASAEANVLIASKIKEELERFNKSE